MPFQYSWHLQAFSHLSCLLPWRQQAQEDVAEMYYNGKGVEKDNNEARKWYAKSKDIKDISLIVFEDERDEYDNDD